MSENPAEASEISSVVNPNSRGIDSLVLMLLSSILNELFVCWSFFGASFGDAWWVIPNRSIFLAFWWFGAHILFVIWVVFWLFRGRIKVPLAVYGTITMLATACGSAILTGIFGEGACTIIGPACFFLSNLLAIALLTRERSFDLLVQVFLSSMMGLGSGLLYLYLYVSSI